MRGERGQVGGHGLRGAVDLLLLQAENLVNVTYDIGLSQHAVVFFERGRLSSDASL